MPQKLSTAAKRRKAARDKATAMTPRRTAMKAENQRKRRAAKKEGKNIDGMDYDHTTSSFVAASRNRSGFGKGTKINNTKKA
jgi:hypothetical protein